MIGWAETAVWSCVLTWKCKKFINKRLQVRPSVQVDIVFGIKNKKCKTDLKCNYEFANSFWKSLPVFKAIWYHVSLIISHYKLPICSAFPSGGNAANLLNHRDNIWANPITTAYVINYPPTKQLSQGPSNLYGFNKQAAKNADSLSMFLIPIQAAIDSIHLFEAKKKLQPVRTSAAVAN